MRFRLTPRSMTLTVYISLNSLEISREIADLVANNS